MMLLGTRTPKSVCNEYWVVMGTHNLHSSYVDLILLPQEVHYYTAHLVIARLYLLWLLQIHMDFP